MTVFNRKHGNFRQTGQKEWSMNVRLVLVGLVLALLAWLSAYRLVQQDYAAEVERTRKLHSNILKGMESHTLALLQDIDEILVLMKETYKIHRTITPEVRAILSASNFSRFADQAAIMGADGNRLFSFAPVQVPVNVADRAYFQAQIAQDTGKPFIGPAVTGRMTGQSVFHVSRRVNNADGSFGGVALVAVSTDYFADVFLRMTLEDINYLLVGTDGFVRATSGDNKQLLGIALDNPEFRRLLEQPATAGMVLIDSRLGNGLRFVSYRIARDYGIVSVVTQPEDTVLSLFRQRRLLYYSAAAMFTLLLTFLLLYLYRASQQQKQLRLSVQAAMEQAEYYLDMAGTLLVALDLNGRVTMLNQQGVDILGYAEEDLLGQDLVEIIIPPEQRDLVRARFQQVITGKQPEQKDAMDMDVVTRDGHRRTLTWITNLLRNLQGDIVGILSSGVDVTERRQIEEELLRLVATDPLTGLSNRRNLLEAGEREFQLFLRQQRPLAACLMDIDHFKSINDRYGHANGDLVLIRLAEVCRATLRTADLCGRFGGEEFVIILPDTTLDTACVAAERLRKMIERQTVETDAGVIRFTVSIGVAAAEPNHTSIGDLIRMADVYMYAAKNSGRNRAVSKITLWKSLPAVDDS
jgi:diguanylate cyclase (GGDEF)-like protein/PAS domain S-box-containing protein